jgi:hypothetical protein
VTPSPGTVVELHPIMDVRRWFAVVNNPERTRPWISKAREYVPGTETDPYQLPEEA